MKRRRFSALDAAERAASLVDAGSLESLVDGAAAGLTVWVGCGRMGGKRVLLGLTDGHDRGGTVGMEEARALSVLAAAAERRREPVIVCWDTGGVRVHDGPAALAATSAVGVGLTRVALLGVPVASVISGPRGCFGAPSVVAAAAHRTLIVKGAHWGLTGPRLLHSGGKTVAESAGRAATAALHRVRAGHAGGLIDDDPHSIREALEAFLRERPSRLRPLGVLDRGVRRIAGLASARRRAPVAAAAPGEARRRRARRDGAISCATRFAATGAPADRRRVPRTCTRRGASSTASGRWRSSSDRSARTKGSVSRTRTP